jgi:hypothetical protein
MVYWYVRDNGHGLAIQVNFMLKFVCVCEGEGEGGFGSNGFVTGITIPKWLVIIG